VFVLNVLLNVNTAETGASVDHSAHTAALAR